MILKRNIFRITLPLLICIVQLAGIEVIYAQNFLQVRDSLINEPQETISRLDSLIQRIDASIPERVNEISLPDTLILPNDITFNKDTFLADSLIKVNKENIEIISTPIDTTEMALSIDSLSLLTRRPVKQFIPNSSRSTWMAVIIPGGGQIYNRKYWKLPIIYGGFAGCAYGLAWNNKTYQDYAQAYIDIQDNDPNTNSYLAWDSSIQEGDAVWINRFKRQKDIYRRYRDLTIFGLIGIYIVSIIDAYVDAELSDFDISPDLGLKIEPMIINDRRSGNAIGIQCSIIF